jgi:Tfp pilus assembly protein PilO
MKVKILLFPLSIVVALALSVLWIKPEVSSVFSLRNQKLELENQLNETRRVVSNISALDRSLNENVGNEQFVKTYLPETGSDDRIFDEINFLAGESGLLLLSAKLDRLSSEVTQSIIAAEQAKVDQKELESVSPGSLIRSDASTAPKNVFVASSPKARVRSTDVSVSVAGRYEQIKAFTERVYRANHFHSFVSVSISRETEKKSDGQSTPDGVAALEVLNADMTIRFSLLPKISVSRGVFLETFKDAVFDFSTVEELRTRVTSELPILDATASERSNPFLR